MIIEHVRRALEHLNEQEAIAEQILIVAGRIEPRGAHALQLAGAWADLPKDMEDTLLRWRREVPPTSLIEDLPGEHDAHATETSDNT
jgi:hypothetical protein